MDEDDDRPILAGGSRRGGTSLSEMSVSMDEALTAVGLPDDLPQGSLSSGTDESRVSRESRARNNGNVSDTRAPRSPAIAERPLLPNLPGITEGEVLPAAAPARRGAGRGPTRERERVRGGGAERPRENGPSLETERFERPRTDAAVVVQRPPRDLDVRDVPDARDDASLSNIFLNVGRRDGVNPGDLQKLLAETGGIPETETSNIRIRDRITFVTVKKELAERAIEILAGQVFGGRTVVAEHARDRP